MKRKTGEIFKYRSEWHQCVEVENRVISKKLKKVGKPFTCNYYGDNRLIMMQEYKVYGNRIILHNGIPMYLTDNIHKRIAIEIKQNKKIWKKRKKTISLDAAKDIYEELKGKTVQCLVNNEDGDLANGNGVVCGYKDKYLIVGFTTEYEGCIKSFTDNGVFLEKGDFLSYRFWNISNINEIPITRPFNLELAKAGKPVCTRDGRKARVICFDLKDEPYPIVAAVGNDSSETLLCYTTNGEIVAGNKCDKDLMMLSEKKEGWINVYALNTCYSSKEEAEENIDRDYEDEYVRTVKISWEE